MKDLVLGKAVDYKSTYDASLLQVVPRILNRKEIALNDDRIFYGYDCWNLYELAWLNQKGMPQVAIGEVYVPCRSVHLIESKSFKLYLNSFNQTTFSSWGEVHDILVRDLSFAAQQEVYVCLRTLNEALGQPLVKFEGTCLDGQDLMIEHGVFTNEWLVDATSNTKVSEEVYSDLLKSNCLITHQPDWGSVWLKYRGNAISHEALLRYIISFRLHNEFHEQCVERIYVDLMKFCNPQELSVYARYTRRGGLDINPYRSSNPISLEEMISLNRRLVRQ